VETIVSWLPLITRFVPLDQHVFDGRGDRPVGYAGEQQRALDRLGSLLGKPQIHLFAADGVSAVRDGRSALGIANEGVGWMPQGNCTFEF
jgi:hypothetical protein